MATELAFLIKDLDPALGKKDTVGIIAKVDHRDFSLEHLLESVKDAFGNPIIQNEHGCSYEVNLFSGLEEVNGALIGCIYITDNGHAIIDDVGNAVLDNSRWSGTIATPAAVALYINQMKDFDCVNPTGKWKGFFNNEV